MVRNVFLSAGITARILVILSIMLLAGTNMACHQDDYVVYEVTGDADVVDILITTDMGADGKYEDVPLPWRMEFGGFDSSYVYLYAHNNSDSGSINATIYVNGRVFRQAATSRPYDTVVVYGEKNN
ncbi:MAG: hypothetical protein NTZ34_08780 [Chloroflexi bacterium]|nr:hypothetical protein [Chloroflexota bacterium]